MFKHSFTYSVIEEFVKIDEQIKKEMKKIKLDKYPLNYNNFYNISLTKHVLNVRRR